MTDSAKVPRVRHHTNPKGLAGIGEEGAIHPSRGDPMGVHVEIEPFGSTRPGMGGPKAETGASGEGAYVEFDLLTQVEPTMIGPRKTAVVPTEIPFSLEGLRPKFVRVRQWWNLWFFWR